MKVSPITNPKRVHLAVKSIEEETGLFKTLLYNFISKPTRPEDTEEFIFLARAALTSWRDQLNKILEYVARDLAP